MKRKVFNTALLLFALPLVVAASHPGWKGKYTKEKKINKEFTVSPDALLKVANRYGNLYVNSWNENKVVIEVTIKVNGDREEKVEKRLGEIDVAFESSAGMVSAKTLFDKGKSWNWGWNNKSTVSMEINYTIKVPLSNRVDLTNDYGSINLDRIGGKAVIDCDYGTLDIGELLADNNELSFDYTSKVTIGFIKSGKISADYSGFEVNKTDHLTIAADYTQSKIKEAGSIHYSCDYGTISIDNAQTIEGNGDYVTASFGVVHGDVTVASDYGSIKIEKLAPDAGNVRIQSDYTGIKIGYHPDYFFDFDIKLNYASLKNDDSFQFNIKREGSHEKYYKGYYGKSGKNNLSIASEYGNVTFYKNQ